MLAELGDKCLNNYSDWLIVTTIIESLGKYDIWNCWNRKSTLYNKKNTKTWKYDTGCIDINNLACTLNKAGGQYEGAQSTRYTNQSHPTLLMSNRC